MAVVMIVVEKSVVAYFLDSCNLGTRIVDFDDTSIVIDNRAVTFAFHKGENGCDEFEYWELGVDRFDWFGEVEYWWRDVGILAGGELARYGDEGSGVLPRHHTLPS
ncbi:hypothetical protein Tco_0016847 [Tanacetum coccineum]